MEGEWLAMLWTVARVAALVYVGFGVLLFFVQEYLIFPGGSSVHTTPDAYGWNYEDVYVTPEEGETTHGWYIETPAEESARGVILFSTGNGAAIADRMFSIRQFVDLGFDVLIYGYGGFSHSSGQPSERRIYADVQAMWDYLTGERGVSPERIALFGRSLGSGVSVELATREEPRAVILESAFLSIPAVARTMFPIFPVDLLVRHRFDNEAKIDAVTMPKLFIHSPGDEVIPYEQGRTLYDMAPEPKQFLEIEGGHNDGFIISIRDYEAGLAAFLYPLFPLPDAQEENEG
ncbi:MAG: alpha/beta hydrolase [Candidatus Hydrogenedentota bacterium]